MKLLYSSPSFHSVFTVLNTLCSRLDLVKPPYCDVRVLNLHFPCTLFCFIAQFTFLATEPGVPYNITVRASTSVGKGEPVSIVVFTVEQGNIDQMAAVNTMVS